MVILSCRGRGVVLPSSQCGTKTSKGLHVVRVEIVQSSGTMQARLMARSVVKYVEKLLKQRKTDGIGLLRSRSSTMLEIEVNFFDLDDMEFKNTMKYARNEVGSATGIRYAVQVAQRALSTRNP